MVDPLYIALRNLVYQALNEIITATDSKTVIEEGGELCKRVEEIVNKKLRELETLKPVESE